MDITTYANTVRDQYQSIYQGFKNGSVSTNDALNYYHETESKVHGLSAVNFGVNFAATARLCENVPAGMIENLQQVLAKSDYRVAAQTYQNGGGDSTASTAGTSSAEPVIKQVHMSSIDPMRNAYKSESDDFLMQYANDHAEDWKATARELGYDISGWQYLDQFYSTPTSVGGDVSTGVPKSKAEDIFRHIASPSEISEFETAMAPQQAALDAKVFDYVTGIMDHVDGELDQFSPYLQDMEAAGIAPDDLSSTLLGRTDQGDYYSIVDTERGADVARFVNDNAGVRALFDAKANQLQNNWDKVHEARVNVEL